MYGSSVGKLSVFAIAGAQNTQLAAYNGNQGNTWHLVQAAFSAPQNYQVNTLILPQIVNKRYFNYHLKDGAYYCYCAYVVRISRCSDFLSPMLTNTGIFLRGLKLSGKSRS